MSLENLRLEVLKLVYRHDRSAADAVLVASELMKFIEDKAVSPQPDAGEQITGKAEQAPKRRKAAS